MHTEKAEEGAVAGSLALGAAAYRLAAFVASSAFHTAGRAESRGCQSPTLGGRIQGLTPPPHPGLLPLVTS